MATLQTKKVLIGKEDLLLGSGSEVQTRQGESVTISKLNMAFIYPTVAAIKALDTSKHSFAYLGSEGAKANFYYYDADNTTAADDDKYLMPASSVGRWVKVILYASDVIFGEYNLEQYLERPASSVPIQEYGDWVAGGVVDNAATFAAALAANKSFHMPDGLYYISSLQSTSASEKNAVVIQGGGMSRTVLMFKGTSGIAVMGQNFSLRDFAIVDGLSYPSVPTTTDQAIDTSAPIRANITAGTIGVRLDRSNIDVRNIYSTGFEIGGINTNTKFYNTFYKCRFRFNEYGHVNGSGADIDSPNFNFSKDCDYSNNFGKNAWIRSGFHVYENTSFEKCADYHQDDNNFPNGGIHIEPGGFGVFNRPYIEDCAIYNANPKTIFNDVSNLWQTLLFAPLRISNGVFSKVSENLILPPYKRTWKSSIADVMTIDNGTNLVSEDKRYSRITLTGNGTKSKVLLSHWSPNVKGIRIRKFDSRSYVIKAGFWFRYVTSNFTADQPYFNVQLIDKDGTAFLANDTGRMNRFDLAYGTKRNATGATGTTTGAATKKLIDSGASFLSTLAPGMRIFNTTTDQEAKVIALDSDTQVTLDDDIFTSGAGYSCGGWQYRGVIISTKHSLASGKELAAVRFNINCELSTTDCSSSNRIFDIAEPEIRFLYSASEGSELFSNDIPLYEVSELTISGGVITVVDDIHTVDTESNAASDDIVTINCDFRYPGRVFTLMAADDARTVVLKDGAGNMKLEGGDYSLDNIKKAVRLVDDGTYFRLI